MPSPDERREAAQRVGREAFRRSARAADRDNDAALFDAFAAYDAALGGERDPSIELLRAAYEAGCSAEGTGAPSFDEFVAERGAALGGEAERHKLEVSTENDNDGMRLAVQCSCGWSSRGHLGLGAEEAGDKHREREALRIGYAALSEHPEPPKAWHDWRCPDCGSGVTKVHVADGDLRGCGKPPGYWSESPETGEREAAERAEADLPDADTAAAEYEETKRRVIAGTASVQEAQGFIDFLECAIPFDKEGR